MVDLHIIDQRQIPDQQISQTVTRFVATPLDEVKGIGANGLLILDIVAEERTELEIMGTHYFREVILPDEKVLVIGPRGLVS